MVEDSGRCKCVEGVMADKDIKKVEREGSDVVCNSGLPLRSGDWH